jgi:hypothetical protein
MKVSCNHNFVPFVQIYGALRYSEEGLNYIDWGTATHSSCLIKTLSVICTKCHEVVDLKPKRIVKVDDLARVADEHSES